MCCSAHPSTHDVVSETAHTWCSGAVVPDASSWSSSHRAHVTAGTSLQPATSTEPKGGG